MIHLIDVRATRYLVTENYKIGVIGENNAEVFQFDFPDKINGELISAFTPELVFNNKYNGASQSYVYDLPSDKTFRIPAELTTSEGLTLMVQFKKGTEIKWKSIPITFTLASSADSSNVNPFLSYQSQWEEEAATDLAAALTHSATESELSPIPPYDEMTLDELVDEVEDTIMLTDEKQFNLDCMQAIISSTESEKTYNQYTNFPILNLGYSNHMVKLPYLKTDRVSFYCASNGVHIGNYIEEVGLDFTSCVKFMSDLTDNAKTNLKKFVLTGFKDVDTATQGRVNQLFYNCRGLIELYCDELNLNRLGEKTYAQIFENCLNLKKIGGFNKNTRKIDNSLGRIDFTGCTNIYNMFKSCSSLEEVRFKPCTSLNDGLSLSLDLSSCGVISKESICSLINALQFYTPGTVKSVKVAYPTIYNHMTNDWYCKVVDEQMHVEICESTEQGAITFEQAIGNLNWTVTH